MTDVKKMRLEALNEGLTGTVSPVALKTSNAPTDIGSFSIGTQSVCVTLVCFRICAFINICMMLEGESRALTKTMFIKCLNRFLRDWKRKYLGLAIIGAMTANCSGYYTCPNQRQDRLSSMATILTPRLYS